MTIPGKEIFRCHDRYGQLQVYDDGNKRYLAFGNNDQQSCQLKAQPAQLQFEYTRAMLLALLFKPLPKNALLLGLGGGSLAHCLHEHFDAITITAVELRRAVIKLAYSHFDLPRSDRLKVQEADANDFLFELELHNVLSDTPEYYDLIFSDIYNAHGIDDRQLQDSYLDQCQQALNQDGWLVLNCWREHSGEAAILSALTDRFAEVRVCTTQSENRIILAGMEAVKDSDKQLRERAKGLALQLGFSLQKPLAKLRKI